MKLSFSVKYRTEILFLKRISDLLEKISSTADGCFLIDSSLKTEFQSLPCERVYYFSGEKDKHLAKAESFFEWLIECKAGRKTRLVVIGGGATTDFGAFTASIYNRGMELVLVPTTLLSAVDSAIGGKTAVNFVAKNLIGSYYPASKVIIVKEFFSSLNEKMIESGKAEIIKVALLSGGRLLEKVRSGDDLLSEESISLAIKEKYQIIRTDVTDTAGKRIVLNWGHTFGHAIERYSGVPHGLAVAAGMVLVQKYSKHLGYTSFPHDELENLMRMHGIEHDLLLYVKDNKWLKFIALDKKRNLEEISMVYLKEAGSSGIINRNLNDILKDLEDLR